MADRAGDEATCAARCVEQRFTRPGIDALHHEAGDAAGRVVLTSIACALQIVEQLLIHITEVLAIGQVVEINAIHLVDHLPQQLARPHVVVGAFKHPAHHLGPIGVGALQGHLLEVGEQFIVDELQQGLAGDALFIGGPAAPLQMLGDR